MRRLDKKRLRAGIVVIAFLTTLTVFVVLSISDDLGAGSAVGELQRKHGKLSQSIETLQELGPDALPYLTNLLETEPSSVRNLYADSFERMPREIRKWFPEPSLDAVAIRARAVDVMGKLGADARPAIPLLLSAAADSEVQIRTAAVTALGNLHTEATSDMVLMLSAALFDASPFVRENACYALERIGPEAKDAVPVLSRFIKSSDVNMALLAIRALGAIGPDAKDALPALKEAEQTGLESVRKAASHAIAQIYP